MRTVFLAHYLLWAELCPPKIHTLIFLTPVVQNVTVFRDRDFKEVK